MIYGARRSITPLMCNAFPLVVIERVLPLLETSPPWHSTRSHAIEGVCCSGGTPWHAVQAFAA